MKNKKLIGGLLFAAVFALPESPSHAIRLDGPAEYR